MRGAPSSARLTADVEALHAVLDEAERSTALPERSGVHGELNDLVVEARLRA
ncbi:hypothetical protein [Streptomyces sp. NPDC002537]